MSPVRALSVLGLLMGVALLAASCGPRPTETAPLPRGTALPPPGVTMAPSR
jgi:hypothetical protein